MNPGLTRAKIAPLVITRARTASRIAWGAFRGNIKIKKAELNVKIALKTRNQPIPNVQLYVMRVVRAEQHHQEAWRVRNVWPGNLKKPQAPEKKSVPLVYRAVTPIRPI